MQPGLFPEDIERDEKPRHILDVCAGRHGLADTSVEANKSVDKETDRLVILGWIKAARSYGMTLDELSIMLNRPPNAISGRLTELRIRNQIILSEARRPTRTGCSARVYVVV